VVESNIPKISRFQQFSRSTDTSPRVQRTTPSLVNTKGFGEGEAVAFAYMARYPREYGALLRRTLAAYGTSLLMGALLIVLVFLVKSC
jgi:hypothetical protein